MSDDAPSDQDTVASDEPKVASAALGRPGDKNMPQKKDLDALFKEAFERVEDMTPEEREEHFPWLKKYPPKTVGPDVAMKVVEEMMFEGVETEGIEAEAAGTSNTTS